MILTFLWVSVSVDKLIKRGSTEDQFIRGASAAN